MDDQELGNTLGRIEAGVKENGARLDRHNDIHKVLDQKVIENSEGLVAIKAKAGLIAVIISSIIAIGGWLLRYTGK